MTVDDGCDCRLCADELGGLDEFERNTLWHVQEYGWSVVAVSDEHEVPGWVYSIGMWHSLRTPEVCMFGLRVRDMQTWINKVGEQVRAGQPLRAGELRQGVIDGFSVMVRPVHHSWNDDLFGKALDFYRRPPLAMRQLIWPDRHGHFPWDPEAGERCRTHQPQLWLPKEDHPPGMWTRLAELLESPFPGTTADQLVLASRRVIDGESPIVGVVHTHQGRWEFFDDRPIDDETDVGMVHLRHLVSEHPHIRDFADLPQGAEAWQQPDGNWSRSRFPAG